MRFANPGLSLHSGAHVCGKRSFVPVSSSSPPLQKSVRLTSVPLCRHTHTEWVLKRTEMYSISKLALKKTIIILVTGHDC